MSTRNAICVYGKRTSSYAIQVWPHLYVYIYVYVSMYFTTVLIHIGADGSWPVPLLGF